MILILPSRTTCIAGSAKRLDIDEPLRRQIRLDHRLAAITAPDRKFVRLGLCEKAVFLQFRDDELARFETIFAAITLDPIAAARRAPRMPPRRCCASASKMLILSRSKRSPISKSLKSWPGVILSAPVPNSRST